MHEMHIIKYIKRYNTYNTQHTTQSIHAYNLVHKIQPIYTIHRDTYITNINTKYNTNNTYTHVTVECNSYNTLNMLYLYI